MKWILVFLTICLNITAGIAQNQREYRICFDIGSTEIKAQYEDDILEMAEFIKREDFSYLKIFGYATKSGSEKYNESLSKKRTYAVYNAISKHTAIEQEKLYMTWLGESADAYDLHYENAKPQTPCVEILIQHKKKN